MKKQKGKYTKIRPNYLNNIVSPTKTDQTYSIQLQEPTNDRMNPIKSSTGFSAMNDDYYINEFNHPKQVEIANDKDQNNEEIIVNNMVHEKVIDQNYSKEDQFDYLLNQNDINHLDFITTLIRLQKPKSENVIQKNDDESKTDIKEIIDLCEEHNNRRIITNYGGYKSNLTANCNLDSFLNDITPRKKGFEPHIYSGEKKGLSIKDLMDITNKRKKYINVSNNKGNGNELQQSKSIIKMNQAQIKQPQHQQQLQQKQMQQGDFIKKKVIRHSSTESDRYSEDNHNHESQSLQFNEYNNKIVNTSELNKNNYQNNHCLILTSGDNQRTKINSIQKDIYDKGINMSNFIIENNQLEIEPFTIISNNNYDNASTIKKSSNVLDNIYQSNQTSILAQEGKESKIHSNQINKSELCNTTPHSQYQNCKITNKDPSLITKQEIPILKQQERSYSYGSFNFQINNKIYIPNSHTYTKNNNESKKSNKNSKQIISIKPIETSSFNDFVNYGSNPLANKPEEIRNRQNEDNNESSSLIIPLNPDSQLNDDFKIQMAEMDLSSLKPKSNVLFSMEQSSYHYNKDQLNNYKTNLSIGSLKDEEEEDEPSQVNEYDFEKNKKQNESKEILFSQNQIHSNNTNAYISSVNLSKLTNFVEMQSKKNLSTWSNVIPVNQPSTEKKDLIIAEIDLFADDDDDNNTPDGYKDEDKTNNKLIVNNYSKEQPSPYTQELKKKINYFDESSLIAKDNAYGSLKHSIVESIKENPIEYDIDELINPQYLFKNNQLSNKKKTFKKHLSRSFCGVVSCKPTVSNTNTNITHTNTKNQKRNLSRTNSSIDKKLSNVCIENKMVTSKAIQRNILKSVNNNKSKTPKQNNKYIKKTNDNTNNRNCHNNNNNSNIDDIKAQPLYKFEPRKKQNSFSEEVLISNKQTDSKLQIVPCDKFQIQQKIDLTKNNIPQIINRQFTSPIHNNKTKYDLDAFSIEVPQTNSSKKTEYSHCVNDLVTDSLRIQRQTQEKSRKKILENLTQIVLSQEKNEKEIKNRMVNLQLNESQMRESASSFPVKMECEKELNQFLN